VRLCGVGFDRAPSSKSIIAIGSTPRVSSLQHLNTESAGKACNALLRLSEYLLAALVAEIHWVDALALHLTVIVRRVDAHGLLHALAARPLFGGSSRRRATRQRN
jgi:hypothetical protein